MLPDVRSLIAAIFTSVAVLFCGFALFAAFRVSHEPLVRLPPAASPLQPLAEGGAAALAFAAAEPFDRRFQVSETQPPGEAVASLLHMLERRQESDQGAQSAVDASMPAVGDGPAAIAAAPADAPIAAAPAAPAADVPATPAAAPAEETTISPMTGEAADVPATPPAAPASADGQTPAAPEPQAAPAASSADATPRPSPSTRPPPDAATASAPAAAPPEAPAIATPNVAAVTAAAEPTPPEPARTIQSAVAPPSAAMPLAEAAPRKDEAAAKKTKHSHVAARHHRGRRPAPSALASQYGGQNASFGQPNFVTAPPQQQPQGTAARPVPTRRARIAASKANASAALGGPFVSPPAR